jgi:hypothetical protein
VECNHPSWTITTPATCTTASERTCNTCDEKRVTSPSDALGHNFTGPWLNNATQHWQECSICNSMSNPAVHNWLPGELPRTCGVCNYSEEL